MRVVGGEARGRRLSAPRLASLRPTSDRVREAIFDVLSARGLVEGATVLDLFCGSGALGIEALSRGASSVVFVDEDRRAIAAVEENLASTGLDGRPGTRLVASEATSYLRGLEESFSLALLDPPYAYAKWPELSRLTRAATLLIEHGGPIELACGLRTIRQYRYGTTLVSLVETPFKNEDDT